MIIADGLKGTDSVILKLEGAKYCPSPKIGRAVMDADIFISLTHFKGHEQTGFGGTLKNIGMGCASIAGKLELPPPPNPVSAAEDASDARCVKNIAIMVLSR